MILTYIIMPTCSTSRTSCATIRDSIGGRQFTYSHETVIGNDVTCEDVIILFEHRFKIFAEFLDVTYKVDINIILTSTYSIIVLYQTSTCCLFHHVEHFLTVAHTVDRRRVDIKDLCTSTIQQAVCIDSLQFI